jgi:hypothetical protein
VSRRERSYRCQDLGSKYLILRLNWIRLGREHSLLVFDVRLNITPNNSETLRQIILKTTSWLNAAEI